MKVSLAVVASLFSAVAHAIMLLFLSRGAPPEDVTKILALQVSLAFALTVFEFGIGRELAKVAAENHVREFRYLNNLHLFVCLAIGLAGLAIIYVTGLGYVPAVLIFHAVAERRISVGISSSIATGMIVRSSVILIMGRTISSITFIALVVIGQFDTATTYVSIVAISASVIALALHFVPQLNGNPGKERRKLTKILSVSTHYWAATLMGQARTLDVAIVALFVPAGPAASYALPARALQPLRLVGTSAAGVAFPLAARREWAQVSGIVRFTTRLGVLAVLATLLVSPIAPHLIASLVGERYESAAVPLILIALGAAINIPGSVISSILQASGKHREITLLGIALLFFQGTALVVLVNVAGINGAAASVLATYVIQLLVVAKMYRKVIRNEMAGRHTNV